MENKNMTIEQLEARKAEIAVEIDGEGADLDALEAEARAINEELSTRKATESKRAEIRAAVASGAGTVIKAPVREEKKKTIEEVRASKEYVDAFAKYVKTDDDAECRALLSGNVTGGQVPVPTVIEGRIRTAWERNGLLNLVRKTYIRGNVRIGFELSATGAVVHTEGSAAPAEETLTFGVINLIPQSYKKWIRISDEALDMGGEEFLFYIYDEITYQIAKKVEDDLVALIVAASASPSATAVGVPVVTASAAALGTVAAAIGALSDEAANPVIVINKATWAAFKAAQYAGNFSVDPFEGLTVYYNSTLPAVGSAAAGQTWMIVGDFGVGAQANFPNGDEIRIKYDDLSLAESDLVKLVGREYIALGLVSNNAFVKVAVGE